MRVAQPYMNPRKRIQFIGQRIELERSLNVSVSTHGRRLSWTVGRDRVWSQSRFSYWLAFAIGLAPDLLSFGVLWIAAILGLSPKPDFSHGTPPESTIPTYVHHLYDVTHSLVVFLVVFLVVWLVRRHPRWELGAWGLHVIMDVPTHSSMFFPTPLWWPLAAWKFDGWPWMTPGILVPNVVILVILYGGWFLSRLRRSSPPS